MTTAALFATERYTVRELTREEVPRLQALFDANPEYAMTVNGRPPNPDEAQVEFDERPPPHLGFTQRWVAGIFDRGPGPEGPLQGTVIMLSDLPAPGVWHVSLFLLATALHGSGAAREVYDALEAWMRRSGAQWLRLGVVAGNARAEAFWHARGLREVRRRHGIDTGGRINDVRVLAKPLAGGSLDDYLARVPRDHPDSTLP